MKKIAVVTGASSGMGRDFVRAVDREFSPQEIWVIARREDRLLALQEQVHATIVPFAMDLSRDEAFRRYQEALERERERAEKERDRMGRVYQTLSLAGGAFLVILLL